MLCMHLVNDQERCVDLNGKGVEYMKKTMLKLEFYCCLLLVSLGMLSPKKIHAASTWETKWSQEQSKMSAKAKDVLQKQVSLGDAETDESEKSTTLQEYEISEAIPVCYLKSDLSMLADYHKQGEDFSKLIQWTDCWYIPAQTMTDEYASVFLQKQKDAYDVSGVYFGEDDLYIAQTNSEIKKKVRQEFDTETVDLVQNILIPFYNLNLLYVHQTNADEFVIPYESSMSDTLETIHEKQGKVYTVEQFVSDMEQSYEEYTDEEIKEIIEKNQNEPSLGGATQPKKKMVTATNVSRDSDKTMLDSNTAYRWGIIIAVVIILGVAFIVVGRKMTNEKNNKSNSNNTRV